ncbi:MAG: carboxypeptidase-like regulatory domain-containing protein, partial [Flavobacteriales bacterium]|nr:carboxypeptidase-like regulatory domain-containing protein [Flavobacteriales bacterium]
MRCILVVFFLALAAASTAQSSMLKGLVTEKTSGDSLSDVLVQVKGNFQYVRTTDENGEFELKLPKGDYFITVSSLNHRDMLIRLDFARFQEPEIFLDIKLVETPNYLSEAIVSVEPDTVYSNETYNVGDLAFIEDDILLLTYEKEDRWKRQEHGD